MDPLRIRGGRGWVAVVGKPTPSKMPCRRHEIRSLASLRFRVSLCLFIALFIPLLFLFCLSPFSQSSCFRPLPFLFLSLLLPSTLSPSPFFACFFFCCFLFPAFRFPHAVLVVFGLLPFPPFAIAFSRDCCLSSILLPPYPLSNVPYTVRDIL